MGATSSILSHKTDAVEGESVVVTKVPDALDVSKVMRGSSMQISSMVVSVTTTLHVFDAIPPTFYAIVVC